MMKLIRHVLIFLLFIVPFTIADINNEMGNKVTVVFPEDAKTDLLIAGGEITAYLTQEERKIYTRLDTEVEDTTGDFVFIGGPCRNKAVQQVITVTDCSLGEAYGKTVLKLIEHEDKHILILAGINDKEMRKVAKQLRDKEITLENNTYVTGEVIPVKEQFLEEEKKELCDCMLNDQCLHQWELGSDAGKPVYCYNGELIPQKEVGEPCQSDLECIRGICQEKVCYDEQSYYYTLFLSCSYC